MAQDDLAADCQTQSCPSNHAFGSKERLEEMGQIIWGDTWTGVGNHRLNHARCARAAVLLEPRAQGDTAGRPYRLQGIDAEVVSKLS